MADLTSRLRGKTVAEVWTNGHILRLVTTDGAELEIAWADDNGRALKGKPLVVKHGVRLLVPRQQQDLIFNPSTAKELRP